MPTKAQKVQSPTSGNGNPMDDTKKTFKILGDKYQLTTDLEGSGSYGEVYKAHLLSDPTQVVAVKVMKYETDEGITSASLKEISSLNNLKHVNIISMLDVYFDTKAETCSVVMEHMELDLDAYIQDLGQPCARELCASYMSQLLEGLAFLHSTGHIHCDIKPNNLLINLKGDLKICDFGLTTATLSKTYLRDCAHINTLWFRPPELLLGSHRATTAVDIWAAGCVLWRMIQMEHAFPGDSGIDTLYKIFNRMGLPTEQEWPGVTELPFWHDNLPKFKCRFKKATEHLSDEVIELLRGCWTLDPTQRVSARSALQNPWIKVATEILLDTRENL